MRDREAEPTPKLVTSLTSNGETWVFIFEPDALTELYKRAGRYAADPELSFTWRNANSVIDAAQSLAARAAEY